MDSFLAAGFRLRLRPESPPPSWRCREGVDCFCGFGVLPCPGAPFAFPFLPLPCGRGGVWRAASVACSSNLTRSSSAAHHLRKSASAWRACSSSWISFSERLSFAGTVSCSSCANWIAAKDTGEPDGTGCTVGLTGGRVQALPLL